MGSRESPATAALPLSGTLQKIADVLGCTVGDFAGEQAAARSPSGAELLKLWERLPDDAARRQVLAVARSLAEESVA